MGVHHDILWNQESAFNYLQWEIVTLKGFYSNDTITGEVIEATYDHIFLEIREWKFSWVKIKVDLHILWESKPKVKEIQHWSKVITLHNEALWAQEFSILSAETEIKKQLVQLLKHYENWYLKLTEVESEAISMWLSAEMLKLVRTVNITVIWLLIGKMQNAQ